MTISWSAMRKKLETENLCDSLKGRITYFATRYRKSHDEMGRVSVLLDGKGVLQSCWFDWTIKRDEAWKEINVVKGRPTSYAESGEEMELGALNKGGFDQFCFYNAYYEYANQSIEKSLSADDPIVKMFAVLDRRVGKRTLENIKPVLDSLPEWLRCFYELRLKSEGLQ